MAEYIVKVYDGIIAYGESEELIRCKDCKHRRDVAVCPMTDISLNVSYAKDEDYCSFAERRDDG